MVIKAVGIEYLSLLFTTPPISMPWVVAEAIVVSETGDRLSPKAPPETIAPIKRAGLLPTKYPTGYNIGLTTKIVPTDVPVDNATIPVSIKVATTNLLPTRFKLTR